MNRLYKVLKTAVWCVIGGFLGVTGYTVFTAVVVGVLLAGMWFLKRRMK